jgi:DNA-binding response OmpR family regulator
MKFTKILILTYDIGVAHMMQIALAAQGFATMGTTENGIFKDIYSFQPHVLILEYKSNRTIRGNTFYEQISLQLQKANIPIILVTSNQEIVEGAKINANAYILKPVDYFDLCNTVKKILYIE